MTLEIITAPALAPLTHGFFTRKGGASSGVYSGLNCGSGSQDLNAAVAVNRERVAIALGLDAASLAGANQVHSPEVLHVTAPQEGPRPIADALVTATPGLALTILTADCGPVLFADHEAGVIGAAHAGWKGALTGVLEATLNAMEGLGARRERIVAVVGPLISQSNYEVGPEFVDRFTAADPGFAAFFIEAEGDRARFDLPGFILTRLNTAGAGNSEWTGHCTYAEPDRFYSYRRSVHRGEPDYGRLISAIRL
jgi:YfiH family protein